MVRLLGFLIGVNLLNKAKKIVVRGNTRREHDRHIKDALLRSFLHFLSTQSY